jgi:hypothetical protein
MEYRKSIKVNKTQIFESIFFIASSSCLNSPHPIPLPTGERGKGKGD